MFNTLLESRPRKQRSVGGTTFSVFAHVTVLTALIYVTAHAAIKNDKEKVDKIQFAEMKNPDRPPPPKEPPP